MELVALRRWLVLETETESAWCPAWYPLFVAANYLHVPPWELLDQSVYWRDKALIAQAAEAGARKILQQHGR